jgi:raffinose/stachyose/melibiose transport system permease protein
LGNYVDLFSDNRFYIALRNNAALMIFYCVLPLVLGIGLAA